MAAPFISLLRRSIMSVLDNVALGAFLRTRSGVASACLKLDGDDEASLAARVLVQEHTIYPLAVRWFAEGRLRLIDGRVEFDAPQASEGALISPLARISP